jgi:hypothetical protein
MAFWGHLVSRFGMGIASAMNRHPRPPRVVESSMPAKLIHEILAPPRIELWRPIQSAAFYIDRILTIRPDLVQTQIEHYRPKRLRLMRLSVYGVGSCATHLVPHGCMHPRQGSSSPFRGPKMTQCELVLDIRASSAKWCDLLNRLFVIDWRMLSLDSIDYG